MRLKAKEVRNYRLELLKKQNFICPLCGTKIQVGEDTLDHDHKTGHVRKVLHRSCNQVEGRVLSWIKRCRAEDHEEFLRALLRYWEQDYTNNPQHPNHRTDIEREIQKLRRRMKKLKTERAKQRYQDKIKALKEKL